MRRLIRSATACLLVLAGLTMSPLSQPETALAADASVATCDEPSFDAALADVQGSGGGTITFDCTGTIAFTSEKTITTNVTIAGDNAVIFDGGNSTRLFWVESGAGLTLSGLRLQNGHVGGAFGGAIVNSGGSLKITASTFSGNSAGFGGGAVYNTDFGLVMIAASTFDDNSTENGGGAIRNAGTLSVAASTFSGNSADTIGGAIVIADGSAEIATSTFSANSADTGGAIYNANAGKATIAASTFSGNSAEDGGAIGNDADLSVRGTILANSPAGGNCSGPLTSQGSNLSDDGSCSLAATGDIPNSTAVNLGPLADNGGPTRTMRPQPDSDAIDAADCALSSEQDQRGVLRPIGSICDIGAVERGTIPVVDSPQVDPSPSEQGESVVASANFSDPGSGDTHTCTVDYGDGTGPQAGTVASDTCTGPGHIYTAAGVFTITVTVTDNALVAGSNTAQHTVTALNTVITTCTEEAFDHVLVRAQAIGGTITFDCSGTIVFTSEKTITGDITILGNGAVTFDGNNATRLFRVTDGARLELTRLALQNGHVDGLSGGAIDNLGTLSITASTFTGNRATGKSGGGGVIYNDGTATITASTFSDNSAESLGGAIYNPGGTLAITTSTFSDNSGDGGAIANSSHAEITASTFSGNSAPSDVGGAIQNLGTLVVTASTFSANSAILGGGIYNHPLATATIAASTFSDNRATGFGGVLDPQGGALYNSDGILGTGTLNVRSTILANSPSGGNCAGPLTSQGSNLSDDSSCGISATGDIQNSATVNLGALGDNGGPTQTMLPGANSAAIDAADCALSSEQDQRGVTRPDAGCDIGAVEAGEVPLQVLAIDSAAVGVEGGSTIITATALGPAASGFSYAFDCDNDGVYETSGSGSGTIGTASCTFPDDGVVTVGVEVCLDSGCATGSGDLTIANAAPVVALPQIAPPTSEEGESVVASATFTDQGIFDTHTCAVDYGDGSGLQNGTVESGTCTGPAHAYAEAGAYTVTVTVTDDAGDARSSTGQHTVTALDTVIRTCTEEGLDRLLGRIQAIGAGTITFTCSGTITFSSQKTITADVAIIGNGAVIFDGNNATRLFQVMSGARLALSRLTLQNGNAGADDGGAILNGGFMIFGGTLEITNSTFTGNSSSARGGAIFNAGGLLEITNSTFTGNNADEGGAIASFERDGEVTVTASTFSGNSAGTGGAIFNTDAIMTVLASTFSGNSAVGSGGAFVHTGLEGRSEDGVTIVASTFSGNSAGFDGAAIYIDGGSPTIRTSILANSSGVSTCQVTAGGITSRGSNLSDDDSCNLTATGDIANSTAVNLGPLADNGGPTQTMLPGANSDAIDAADCALSSAIDQRGVTRPDEGCDIGAVEVEGTVPVQIQAVDNDGPVTPGQPATITVDATGPAGAALTYEFDCDNDGEYEISQVDEASAECTFAEPGSHVVAVQVSDGTSSATGQTTVEVQEAPASGPAVTTLTLDPSPSNEGGEVALTAAFTHPDPAASHGCTLDWGDGTAEAGTVDEQDGTGSCAGSHVYADDGEYTVSVEVCSGEQCDQAETKHAVTNVAPVVDAPQVDPAGSKEGQNVVARASFSDPGTSDTQSCTVDYGDGSGLQDGTVEGGSCLGAQHRYADDGEYTIIITVCDDDESCDDNTATQIVANVSPTLANLSAPPTDESGMTALSGDISDPGTQDSFSLQIDWGDGSAPQTFTYAAGTTSFSESHTYPEVVGDYPGTATLCDDDEGCVSAEFIVSVPDREAPTITLVSRTPANAAGWNNTAVTVTWSCADASSAVVAATVSQTLTTEGAGQAATGTCEDAAGNTSSQTVSAINIDLTAPQVLAGGPYTVAEGATVTLDGGGSSDGASGVGALTWDLDGDGVYETANPALFSGLDGPASFALSLRVTDVAGNVATAETTVSVTNVAPTISQLTTSLDSAGIVVTVIASDPVGAADPLSYAFDCDGSGEHTIDTQAENSARCPRTVLGAVQQIRVEVSDGDGGVTNSLTSIAIPYEMCVNQFTGMLREKPSRGCAWTEESVSLPEAGPLTVCVGLLGSALRAAEDCGQRERALRLPDDGPLPVCVNLLSGFLRAPEGPCAYYEIRRVIGGAPDL